MATGIRDTRGSRPDSDVVMIVRARSRVLQTDLRLYDQLAAPTRDTEVTAEQDSSRRCAERDDSASLEKRLLGEMDFGPMDMAAELELTARIRWAAEEALRIEPALGTLRRARRRRDGSPQPPQRCQQ